MTSCGQGETGAIAAAGKVATITPAALGGGAFGFSTSPSAGSFSSTTFKGVTIDTVFSDPAGLKDLRINLTPGAALPKTFFSAITVIDSAGVLRTYLTSAASFSVGNWSWGTGASPVYTNTTARQVILHP